MRVGMIGLLASVALLPRSAAAGGHHEDHDGPTVRDHRTHDNSDSAPVVRDHRTHEEHDAPVVRDHRSEHEATVVRDHRRTEDVYFAPVDDVVVQDSGPSEPFANVRGPTWMFEIGGLAQRFRGPAFNRNGSVETLDGSMSDYGLASGTPTSNDSAGGSFDMRFIVPTSEHLYAGAELGIGGLTRTPIRLMTDDSSDLHLSSRSLIGSNLVVGARARLGIAELDGEVAGGARIVSMTVQSVGAYEDDPSETESSLSPVVEARLRGALWVTQHVFVAAQAGVGVLDRDDRSIGFSIGVSSRAFGQIR